jgi:hypothetical protein
MRRQCIPPSKQEDGRCPSWVQRTHVTMLSSRPLLLLMISQQWLRKQHLLYICIPRINSSVSTALLSSHSPLCLPTSSGRSSAAPPTRWTSSPWSPSCPRLRRLPAYIHGPTATQYSMIALQPAMTVCMRQQCRCNSWLVARPP